MYSTREEWLREAVKLLNSQLFEGTLDLIEYQISCSLLSGKKLGEVVFPYEGEDVKLDDFFPPTIHIDEKIKEPYKIVATLAHECIHAFMNIKKHNKAFGNAARKIGFEPPFTQFNPSNELIDTCKSIASQLGEFPGKPVIPHAKQVKPKTFTGVIFCPECGYELRVSEKMFKGHGEALPTCVCGAKMALDRSNEEGTNEEE